MPDSTHHSHGVEINLELVTAGSDEISVDMLNDEQLKEFQSTVLNRLSAMSPREFFRDGCNVFDTAPTYATGWMMAKVDDAGEISIVDKKRDQMYSVKVALKMADETVFKRAPYQSGPQKGEDLPEGYFWLSYEEAMGNVPVFLAQAGENGPLVNIGTWLKIAQTYEVADPVENPEGFADEVLRVLEEAGNPSHSVLRPEAWDEGLKFELADLKEFLEAHNPAVADDLEWPESPAP